MNRTDRLVAMVMQLQGRRVVRAEELAQHFEISLRTVYRDIAALGEAGVPVIGEAGVGYTLVKGYHLPPVMLTAEEASALFTGGELAKKFTDGSLDEAVDGALAKLRAVLPPDRKDQLEHLARGTVIGSIPRPRGSDAVANANIRGTFNRSFSTVVGSASSTAFNSVPTKVASNSPANSEPDSVRSLESDVIAGSDSEEAVEPSVRRACLSAVQQAVASRRVLGMIYRARESSDDTVRDVEPLGVAFYGGNWYLVAWCRLRGGLRHFRVDRIRNVSPRTETFGSRDGFSLSRHLEEYAHEGETFPAKIWFANNAHERANEESYATLVAGTQRDGGTEFSLLTWSYEWLARWVLSFGETAEALEPSELRARVREAAEAIARRHFN